MARAEHVYRDRGAKGIFGRRKSRHRVGFEDGEEETHVERGARKYGTLRECRRGTEKSAGVGEDVEGEIGKREHGARNRLAGCLAISLGATGWVFKMQ